MKRIIRFLTCALLILLLCPVAMAQEKPEKKNIFDVIVLVDSASSTAELVRGSVRIVVDAMGDAHRLGIGVVGPTSELVFPLSRISTVEDKTKAVAAFSQQPLDATASNLESALDLALERLTKEGREEASKVVLLLSSGRPGELENAAQTIESVKTRVLPEYVSKKVVIHTVGLGDADLEFLQVAANITGGKCLVAPTIPIMTDALDTLVERLEPPREIVVPKVISAGSLVQATPNGSSTPKRSAFQSASGMVLAFFAVAVVIIAILAAIVYMLFRVLSHVRPKKEEERAEPSNEVAKEGGFAALRDVSNGLHNLLVDASELSEHLNLDLEDFGVEGWKKQKALKEKYGELARGVFLLIDHLEIGVDDAGQDLGWLHDKIGRILEDENIDEMAVDQGDEFDGQIHVHVGEDDAHLPPGTVIQVKRKGYVHKDGDEKEPFVLRRAEVVVQRGKPEKKPEKKSEGKGGAKK